jgi:hypothetical protein
MFWSTVAWLCLRSSCSFGVGVYYIISTLCYQSVQMAFTSQANCTERSASAYERRYYQLVWIDGVAWSEQRILTTLKLGFVEQSRYFFTQVTWQISSWSWMDKQTSSLALSPRANYTDSATATCRRNLVPTFVDRGVSRGQRGGSLTVVNLSFLDRSR